MIPEKYRFLSGSMLKTIALVTMIIDHIAAILLKHSSVTVTILSKTITLYDLMRKIGRIAFPIYCFLLVEGFHHTKDKRRYAVRLFAFALISEIPWNLAHFGTVFHASQNVFFTLGLGFLGICCLERYRQEPVKMCAGLVLLYLIALLLKADYGVVGYGLILAMYLARESRILQSLMAACFLSSTWAAGLAVVPISFYNGKRGYIQSKAIQYAFYAAYPLHMLILYLIRIKTIGY